MTRDEQPAARPGPAWRREAGTVAFLVVVAGTLALWRTTDRGLFTAHEARAARVARHMLAAEPWPADRPAPWLVPQFSPDARAELNYQKPPLYYWAVAAASLPGGGVTRLTVRLPSALAFVALVIVTYFLGSVVATRRTGLLAALVLCSTPKILWWSRAAVLDPMLVACIAAALLFFLRAHLGRGGAWQSWLFWALVGLGTLVKATSLAVPLLAVGLYLVARSFRPMGTGPSGERPGKEPVPLAGPWPLRLWRSLWRLKPISGPLVLLAVAAPWHMAAHFATGGVFSEVYWGVHVFGRATGAGGVFEATPVWLYLASLPRDFFPWIVFLPGALVHVWRAPSRPVRDRLLFPFVWFVGSFLFLTAVSFRKDEYLFVAFPAAAVLVGYFLDYTMAAWREDAALRPWVKAALWVVAGVTVLVAAGLAGPALSEAWRTHLVEDILSNETDRAVFAALGDRLAGSAWLIVLLTGPMAVGAALAILAAYRSRPGRAALLVVCTTILAYVVFLAVVVPTMERTRGLASFAADVRVIKRTFDRRMGPTRLLLGVVECHELAFELGESDRTLLESLDRPVPEFLAARLAAGELWLVVTDREVWEAGMWETEALGFDLVYPKDETPPVHRRPMVLLAPYLKRTSREEVPHEKEMPPPARPEAVG